MTGGRLYEIGPGHWKVNVLIGRPSSNEEKGGSSAILIGRELKSTFQILYSSGDNDGWYHRLPYHRGIL